MKLKYCDNSANLVLFSKLADNYVPQKVNSNNKNEYNHTQAQTYVKRIAVLVFAVLLIVAFTACNNNTSTLSAPNTIQPSISEAKPSVVPSASPSVAPSNSTLPTSAETIPTTQELDYSKYDFTKAVQNVVECYAFEQLSPEQQQKIKKYEAMGVEEFQALPYDQQLSFAYWIYQNFKNRAEYVFSKNGYTVKYTENPTTAKDYAGNIEYILAFASILNTYSGKPGDGLVTDKITAKKFGAMYIHNQTKEQNDMNWNLYIDTMNITGLIKHYVDIEASAVVNNQMVINWVVSVDIGYGKQPNGNSQMIFDKFSFVSILNENKTIYTCIKADNDRSRYINLK